MTGAAPEYVNNCSANNAILHKVLVLPATLVAT